MRVKFNALDGANFKFLVDGVEVTGDPTKVELEVTEGQWWPQEFQIFGTPAYRNQPPDAFGLKDPANATRWVYDQTTDEPKPDLIRDKLATIQDPHLDMVWFDIEHWQVQGATAQDLDHLRKLSYVISTAKTERPEFKYAYYGEVPPRDYWAPVSEKPDQLAAWDARIEARRTLFDLVDYYLPSIYAFYDLQKIPGRENEPNSIDAWEKYARANIAKCTGRGKPVYPFIWPSLHPSGAPSGSPYVGDEYFRRMLDVCYDTADGVWIWGAGFHDDWANREVYDPNVTPDWLRVLNEFKADNGLS